MKSSPDTGLGNTGFRCVKDIPEKNNTIVSRLYVDIYFIQKIHQLTTAMLPIRAVYKMQYLYHLSLPYRKQYTQYEYGQTKRKW